MGRKPGRRLIVGAVALVLVLAAIVWRASVPICSGTSPRYPDKGRLYRIAEALVAISPDGDFPMKDGALDVYAVFRNGSISIEYEAKPEDPSDDVKACLSVFRDCVKKLG